jgi:hypothetical protein
LLLADRSLELREHLLAGAVFALGQLGPQAAEPRRFFRQLEFDQRRIEAAQRLAGFEVLPFAGRVLGDDAGDLGRDDGFALGHDRADQTNRAGQIAFDNRNNPDRCRRRLGRRTQRARKNGKPWGHCRGSGDQGHVRAGPPGPNFY